MRIFPWGDDASNMRSLVADHIVIHIPHTIPFVEVTLFKEIMLHIEGASFDEMLVLNFGFFEVAGFEGVAVLWFHHIWWIVAWSLSQTFIFSGLNGIAVQVEIA